LPNPKAAYACGKQLILGINYVINYNPHKEVMVTEKYSQLSWKKKSKSLAFVEFFIRTAAVVMIFMITGIGCVDRPRDNPLDPQNPRTHGKPTALKLSCKEQQVFISWDQLDIRDLMGMNIYRKGGEDTIFKMINNTPIPGLEFIDEDVVYGLEYEYQITAETQKYESIESESKTIIPGPTYTWVADSYIGQITRYCHDMRYNLFRIGSIAFPTAIAASSSDRTAWVLEEYSNRIYKISDQGRLEVIIEDLNSPTALAVNQQNGDVWIAQQSYNTVSQWSSQGIPLRSFAAFEQPVALDVHELTNECWVVDNKARNVSRIYGQQVYALEKPLVSPQDIAVDPENHAIWVADSTYVLRYDYPGHGHWTEIDGFFWATLVTPCKVTNCCWIVDLCEPGKPAKLLKVNAQGNILFELGEFYNPKGISVNRFDGSCFVADLVNPYSGYGQLVKVSSDGKNLEYINNVSGPIDVSVENH
jgi:hypothetical protein